MIDSFGRDITYLRLSVTELCNLRCKYCMPEDGVCKKKHEDMLTEDEMIMAVQAAASLGITKLRITGGEPLVKKNILSICRRASQIPGINELCITTNGTRLSDFAWELKDCGVSRVNVSLDSLNPKKYAFITGRNEIYNALSGIDAALAAGFDRVKINTVLIGGFNDDEIAKLAELTVKFPLDLRFIELMPMYDSRDFGEKSFLPVSEVLKALPDLEKQEADGGVAKLYKLPGALGNIGLISPLSDHFCGYCNRVRLTADGKIKPCLHSDTEVSIKGMDFEGMKKAFSETIFNKPACHPELSDSCRSTAGRNMNEIGG
ncbi:MAG: GTP 3',8-cyclase MoaA [Ruminococcaceae bacterium]|nr:GTP 3',8-cyclase MoaA [Oscillospiraceae bacterium]